MDVVGKNSEFTFVSQICLVNVKSTVEDFEKYWYKQTAELLKIAMTNSA